MKTISKIYEDGSKYVGEFKDGKYNGQGTFYFEDGSRYVGEWKDGKKSGRGTLNYENGSKYSGEWQNDKRNGRGVFTNANGEKYEGEFKDDERTGQSPGAHAEEMETNGEIQEIRIFLSSTFMDLNNERQYLMNRVFPVFATKLKKRAIDLNVIDLRWGVQPEEKLNEKGEMTKVNKNTLEVCLKEAQRCFPLFIGIIGGRYGWIPEPNDVDLETDFYKKHKKKIDSYLSQRKSMTEMEILFGALERETAPIDYRFYLGNEKTYHDKPENYAVYTKNNQEMNDLFTEAQSKQKALRDLLVKTDKTYEETFADAAGLGEAVMKDMDLLIGHLERQGRIPMIDLREEELRSLEIKSFEKQKAKGYIKREAEKILKQYLDELILKTNHEEIQPLFLVGTPGTGKSSLIANLSKQLDKNTMIKTIKIYVGIHYDISTQKDLIRHLLVTIKERYDIETDVPKDDELFNQFETWLTYITEPTLIIIDGINQLADYSEVMSWIPIRMFSPVGILITSTGSIKIGHQNIYVNEHRITGFTMKEKEQFINEYLIQASKNISNEGKAALMDRKDELDNNPLFISVILQELIRSGRRDYYTQDEIQRKEFPQDSVLGIIYSLISCPSMEDLFVKLFARYENDYGEQLVEQLLSLITISRKGIYYKELVDLTNQQQGRSVSGIEFQSLFSILEDKLINIGGKLAFYHAYLKNAIQKKYAAGETGYREQLVLYYNRIIETRSEEIDLHHAEELTYQLEILKRWHDLFDMIGNTKVLYWMLRYYENDVSGYFKHFKEMGYNFSSFYEKIKTAIKTDEKLSNLVGNLFLSNGEYELSIRSLEDQESELLNKYGEEDPNLWTAWHNLGTTYRAKGEYEEAVELLQKVADKREDRYGEEDAGLLMTQNSLALTYFEKGELDKAIYLFQKVAEKQKEKYGEDYPGLMTTWNNLALSYIQKGGMLVKAIELLQNIESKEKIKYGEDYPGVWIIWSNLALANSKRGDFDTSIGLFQEVAEKQEVKYGDEYPDLWTTWSNLGENYADKGELDKAISLFEKVAAKIEGKYGEEYPDLWITWSNLAAVYKENGEIRKAIRLYEKVASKRAVKFGEDYSGLWTTWCNLAAAYKENGEMDKSENMLYKVAEKQLLKKGFLTADYREKLLDAPRTFTFEDGSKYAGEFKNGIPEGQGTITFADGSKYVGEVEFGLMNGKGTYTYANGNIYEGEVRHGEISGQGRLRLAGTRVILRGTFKNGELE